MKTQGYFLVKKGEANEAFQLRDVELQDPLPGQVSIAVEGFGINYADVMARRGLYREAPPFPCIVGYEVVGIVTAVGSSADEHWIGSRVVAFTRFGGYARQVVTQLEACVLAPEGSISELLSLCTQGVTAYYMAAYLSPVQAGENVLIHAAAGGVGSLLIQLCKHRGANVFAKVGSDDKQSLSKELGADFTVNYKKEDYATSFNNHLKGEKMDVIFNPVGGSTFTTDKKLLDHGGRIFLFGGAELSKGRFGLLSQLNFLRKMGLVLPIGLMMGSRSILGINMLKIADHKPEVLHYCLEQVVQLFTEGHIRPISGGVYHHEQLEKAHFALESGSTVGKIAITW